MEIPTYPKEDELRAQQEHNEKFLLAMRIIFAWSKKWEEATPIMPVYHRYLSDMNGVPLPRWKAFIDNKMEVFDDPEKACIAIADFIVRLDPTIKKGL